MNKSRPAKSLTLIELIISIAIISIIVLGFTSLDLYSRHNVLSASRRAKVQNAVSYALDHMTKKIANAIGDSTDIPDTLPVNTDDIGGNTGFKVRIDRDINGNSNGKLDESDIQIAYVYDSSSCEVWYYENFATYPGPPDEVIAKNILPDFSAGCPPRKSCVRYDETGKNNYIEIKLSGCWDATRTDPGSQDNPEITMLTRIEMLGVSTN